VSVRATVVSVGLTLDSSVEAFNASARSALSSKLRSSLACVPPTCVLELRVAAASVAVTARLTIPDDTAGVDVASTRAEVIAAAQALAAQSPAQLSLSLSSETLSVSAVNAATVSVDNSIVVPLVVAPPLPELPQPVEPPPPSSPVPTPTTPPRDASAASGIFGDLATMEVGAAAAGLVVVVVVAILGCVVWNRRRKNRNEVCVRLQDSKAAEQAAETTLRQPVAAHVRQPEKKLIMARV